MKKCLVSCLIAGMAIFGVQAASLEICRLRCEDSENPVGVACAQPRLTWSLRGDEPAVRPAFAEVRLAAGGADLGSVPTRKSSDLFSYACPALESGVEYRWQVRLANADGSAATSWSAPARFVVALQDDTQWEGAHWIGEREQSCPNWTDYDYQVKFEKVKEAFGVFFRAHSPTCGYMWQVNFVLGSPKLRPHVFTQGRAVILPAVELSPFFPNGIDPERPHTLKISLRGTRIRTYLDGVQVNDRTDATYADGTIGVRTSVRESARVEEVSVTADGKSLLLDRFKGHIMPAFRNPPLEGGRLLVSNKTLLHRQTIPKNCPCLRKTFALADKPIASAVASACGLGFYELWINGAKADPSRVLAPAMASPDRAALFDTYDVTALLKRGADNTVGFWLAAGYSDDFSRYGWHWLGPKCAILHLKVRYADGTSQTVVTDGTWSWTDASPISSASIYHGETYDASKEDPSWCLPSGTANGWRPAILLDDAAPARRLANDAPPVRMLDPRRPVKIVETAPGVFTADFGQNRAGFVQVHVRGPKGTRISLHTSELLGEDGKIDPWTNRDAKSRDEFVLAGTGAPETYTPRFTYHGFRYVEITGWPGRPTADDLTAWAVHADVDPIGSFRCSDDGLNWLADAATWSMFSNFVGYPTDCCMRNERTPCQMDSQAYEDAALQFFDMARYYAKWLDDIRGGRGNPDWTGDSVTLPARLWTDTGDTRIYAARYDDMKGQVDALVKKAPDLIFKTGFGDWCAPNDGTWKGYFNDVEIVNTSIFCEMVRIVSDAAKVLGKDEDAAAYAALHARAKDAFHKQFYHPDTHTYGDGSQTTAVLPLAFGIVPAECRAAVADQLLRTIREKDACHVNTGIYGTRYLGDVLCDLGEGDLFVRLCNQPDYPGFGFMRAKGATTLWEQWTFKGGMNSHNHAMFSGAAHTLMTRLGGIRPAAPGFAEIEICPVFPSALDWVEASRETPRGRVSVVWRRANGRIALDIAVPPFTPAVLRLPGESARPLSPGRRQVVFAVP